mgnify:FL=1
MRKLCSIQQISKIEPIVNSDSLEKATILGWVVCVKKGEFKSGDLCVYCEIDSIMPEKPEFEFLRPRNFRIKTIRLRSQISQGLALPLTTLPSLQDQKLGDDVTELLGVTQWQPKIPTCLAGKVKGAFPSFMPKTDETRIQVLQDVLTRHKGTRCYITEKVDGTSITVYLKDSEFGVCSRNLELLEDGENAYWKVARSLQLESKLKAYGKNIALQGELIGNGIQGNKLGVTGQTILFFNVFDINSYKYLDYNEFITVCNDLTIETVPIINDCFVLADNISELVQLSTGKSLLNKTIWREGIVIRPLTEAFDMQMASGFGNGRLSFKVINPEFLITYGE